MEQDKMREDFEAWHRDRYPAVDVRRQNLLGTYTLLIVEQRWECWQASRAAMVVELPEWFDRFDSGDRTYWVEDVEKAINAAGIRTK
ncbi:hypothetical protein ACFSKY_22835 [Azotobacter chroococcum]|uniref:Uncharacterized protein n=1 Tax=Azotobacter chroococcum TaxID=353 RepID=A0A4R1P6A4_9GAMM|nr:hypothetical protein [Azotobacter chroococcum]TBV95278.1 hypothetical protein E0E53_12975 [Azotobacter chroococcum]TCL22096.1 hypothetical protein EV691_13545 [Azotobacter chroococcum]